MIVIDTSVWIEFLKQNPPYASHQAKIWFLDKKLNNILGEDEKFEYSIPPRDDLTPENDDASKQPQ